MSEQSRRKIFPEKFFSKLRDRERKKLKFILKKRIEKQTRKNYFFKNQCKNTASQKSNKNMNETVIGTVGNTINNVKDMHEWQYQHQVAYWKSRALSLEAENKVLHDHIRKFYSEDWNNKSTNKYNTQYSLHNEHNSNMQQDYSQTLSKNPEVENEENSQDDSLLVKFVVDDAWLQFMEHTERHRRQLRIQKETESVEGIKQNKTRQDSKYSNKNNDNSNNKESSELGNLENPEYFNEMARLYGKGAALIRACEAAIQFSFEHHAKNTIQYWPHISFKI